ncbi:MAG: hypothetical protein ABIS50_10365 [Luteolibacter sp.]|uniref:RCC1 domain-containing protein n=1 Tax=Luteolibacter sp. TaxID=1962973 RepID=UPI0032637FFD
MKICSLPLVLLSMASATMANTPPTVVIQSAAMRPGTTLMDVVYRVNDPDDATVKTRALAFVDGTRSFAKVLRPTTFVEGTAAKLGDTIPANVDHTLTWNVGADWNIDLGQVKFEVLATDQRGLLPFDWITIPAAGGKPAITISKDAPTDAQVLNALFWQYAAGDAGLTLTNGVLRGNSASGAFKDVDLASGTTVKPYSAPFVFKRMNLAAATGMNHAIKARAGLLNANRWHAENRAYDGLSIVIAAGDNSSGQSTIAAGVSDVTAISAGNSHSLALKSDGTVAEWGEISISSQVTAMPADLDEVTAISAGEYHNLVLKNDGTVVTWGGGTGPIPAGLSGVTAIAAGSGHNLALKSDGSIVAWGNNYFGQATVPAGLSGVTAIAAGKDYSLALKSNGTLVAWGNKADIGSIPAGLSGVIAMGIGANRCFALKSNGTVVSWGLNAYVPPGLSGITAISVGPYHSLALKSDGTVVAWGENNFGQIDLPAGLSGVIAIAAGGYHNLMLKAKAL